MKRNEINKIATYSQKIVSLMVRMNGVDLFDALLFRIMEWVNECFGSYLGFETHKYQTISKDLSLAYH